jgi:hypothetical protein
LLMNWRMMNYETPICAKIVVSSHHRILGEEASTSSWC